MMKKLMVLSLVLAVAGLANAGLKIGYVGPTELAGGSTVNLSIFTDAAIPGDLEFFAMVVDTTKGAVTGGTRVLAFEYASVAINPDGPGAVETAGMPVPEGTEGVWGYITVFGLNNEPAIAAGATIFDGISFDFAGTGDALVQLFKINGSDWSLGELYDTKLFTTIIPEPMTMGLLGLGALFLRRRK